MEPHVVYCSACDRNVDVIVTNALGEPGADRMLAPVGICLDYCVELCTGSMCALSRVPEAEVLVQLRRSRLPREPLGRTRGKETGAESPSV